jgi:hypothetical protein
MYSYKIGCVGGQRQEIEQNRATALNNFFIDRKTILHRSCFKEVLEVSGKWWQWQEVSRSEKSEEILRTSLLYFLSIKIHHLMWLGGRNYKLVEILNIF